MRDTQLLKKLRSLSQIGFTDMLGKLDKPLLNKIMEKSDVIGHVLEHGGARICEWLRAQQPAKSQG